MHSILTIDGSISMRQMVSFTLKNASFNVVEAVNVEDAWKKAAQYDFSLVLMEWNLPESEDGDALLRRLRASQKFKSTPILVLTTETNDQMKLAGHAAGATGWLFKPFDPAKLIEVIGKVIR